MPCEPNPAVVVWELTSACTMKCRHCCTESWSRAHDELSTTAALDLCDQLVELGVGRVTFTGGEPLLRSDWPLLTRRLTAGGICVSMVTNGWLLTAEHIATAIDAGLETILISLDGLEPTHDQRRRRGSFARIAAALRELRARGRRTAVATTVTNANFGELAALGELLGEWGVDLWQLQLGLPLGNLRDADEQILAPEQLLDVLQLALTLLEAGRVRPYIGDSIGYCTKATEWLQSLRPAEPAGWAGCPAGRSVVAIRQNGDVSPCLTLRRSDDVEGNLRQDRLSTIWSRPAAFTRYRERSRADLTGFCQRCQFGDRCLGGCTALRRSCDGSDGETSYCAHRVTMTRLFEKADLIDDVAVLEERTTRCLELGLLELAEHCRERTRLLRSST